MKNQQIAGFVTDYGGPMSHTAILARSLGIPAVVGTRGATTCLQHGERLVLDASNGIVLADCDEAMLRHFQARRDAELSRVTELRRRREQPAITRDGQTIRCSPTSNWQTMSSVHTPTALRVSVSIALSSCS